MWWKMGMGKLPNSPLHLYSLLVNAIFLPKKFGSSILGLILIRRNEVSSEAILSSEYNLVDNKMIAQKFTSEHSLLGY